MKNRLFYTENGKFYISRQAVEAAFIHFVGSLQPNNWKEATLKARFEMLLQMRKKENDGVFAECFAMAKEAGIANWVFTDVLIADASTVHSPNATMKVLVKSTDQTNLDDYEQIEDYHLSDMESHDFEDYDILTKPANADFSKSKPKRLRSQSSRAGKQMIDKEAALGQKDNIGDNVARPRFEFADFGIPVGATLTLFNNEKETVEVLDGGFSVKYTGPQKIYEALHFTPLTRAVMGKRKTTNFSPMDYWCYEGKRLRQLYNEKYGDRKKQKYIKAYKRKRGEIDTEQDQENDAADTQPETHED